MDELKGSDTWRLMSKEEQAIKELKKEVEMKKREERVQREIAPKMLGNGISVDLVVKSTGLKKKQIKALTQKKQHVIYHSGF